MAFRVNLHVTGICAFAFAADFKSCTLLLPRATDPNGRFGSSLPPDLHPDVHSPFLTCLLENLDLTATTWLHTIHPGANGRAVARFDLSDADLDLVTDFAGGLTRRSLGGITDFDHTIPLLEVAANAPFRPACFDPIRPATVITRLRFDQGELWTSSRGQYQGQEMDYDFKPVSDPTAPTILSPRRVADFVTLTIPQMTSLLRFQSSDTGRTIALAASSGVVELSISNFDANPDKQAEERVLDYLWFYELLQLPAGTGDPSLVVPRRATVLVNAFTPSTAVCPPGRGARTAGPAVASQPSGDSVRTAGRQRDPKAPHLFLRRVWEEASRSGSGFGEADLERLAELLALARPTFTVFEGTPSRDGEFLHCLGFGASDRQILSAILWDRDVVVTANHLVRPRSETFTVRVAGAGAVDGLYPTIPGAVAFPDGASDYGYCHDLAVLKLARPVGLGRPDLAKTADVVEAQGAEAILVGFGQDPADGNPPPAGIKQQGLVVIGDLDHGRDPAVCPDRKELVIRPKDTPRAASPWIGDSGGSVHIQLGGVWKLAAMVSRPLITVAQPPTEAACLRLDLYAGWIDQAAAELRRRFPG